MKLRLILLAIVTVFILTACYSAEKTLHFEAESDNWQVKYITDVIEKNNSENGTIQMKFIGEDDAPEHVKYSLVNGGSEDSGERDMEDVSLEITGLKCSGCKISTKDDQMEMTIEWADHSETFEMKNTDK